MKKTNSSNQLSDETTLRRLVYIKSLYDLAIDDLQKGNDVAISRSIITLDNCIETFFWIILKKRAKESPKNLEEKYTTFHHLLGKIQEYEHSLDQNSISELHEIRNNIQHHGQLIAKSQAERLFVAMKKMLVEMTRNQLGIDFNDISLSVLIRSDKLRYLIRECENYFAKNDFQKAARLLIMGFELAKLNRQGNQFGSGITGKRFGAEESARKYPYVKDVVEYTTTLDSEIEVMKLGLDYMSWRLYRLPLGTLDPHAFLYRDWGLKEVLNTEEMSLFEDKNDSIEFWVRVNLNFVIESILRWENASPFDELSPF